MTERRVLAARRLGLAAVPVIELAHLSEAQKRAYVLADNQLAEQAGWDREMLALEVADLNELGIDLGSLGFEAGELDALLGNGASDPREEETPEPPAHPVSRPGDLWQLGPHRLLCGSATDPEDVARLLAGVAPHLMVTDPPYGVSYDPAWRNRTGGTSTKRIGRVMNDDRADSVALSEAEVHWRAFLESLQARGLRGVEYVVSDDHAGLRAARRTVFGGATWQRCQFHLAQNAVHHAPSLAIRRRIGAELGVFTAIDRAALAAYCQAYGRWVEAEERLREAPLLYKTPSGYVQQSPWLGIVHKQLELMGRYMTELGMTPASRSRVSVLDTPVSPCLQIERVTVHALSDAELERIALARPEDRTEIVRHGG